MTRRDFAAALAALTLLPPRRARAFTYPVLFARPNPYDAALRYFEPGSDGYAVEKAAADLQARMARIFAGKERGVAALEKWLAHRDRIQAARFFPLPGDQMRFEIKTADPDGLHYHTGIWQLPEFRAVESSTISSPKPYFRDVTGHVFGGVPSFREQLLNGNLYWRARLDSAVGIDVYGNQGIAVGDIDGDGFDEVYVCQPGGLPNRLYKWKRDGTALDITERAGLAILDDTTSALFADFRNSGRQDLVILRAQGPLLFLNQGDGTFREEKNAFRFAANAQGSFTGMAAADYDRDGRLDLYLCCYVYFQSEDQYQFPAPYHDARNGPPNFLFRNRGDGDGIYFEDVTAATGINHNNDRFSFAPAWCDFDGDGWPDLYVANDFGRNNFYRNRQGRFRDEAEAAGVEDMGPGMSASWFDYDGDGRPDLYVSNMWTAAGKRVVADPQFQPAALNREAYRRHTKGNSLYRNRGDGTFEERPREKVEMGRWAWGSGGFDFDLDGSPEILIAAGMTTNDSERDAESFFWRQVVAKSPPTQSSAPDYENGWSAINQLIREDTSWSGHQPNVFYVRRGEVYQDASGVSGLDLADDTRAFAVTDFDGDGYPDLLLKSRLGPQLRAMQNDCAAGKTAIALRLEGTKSNRDAIGARVEVNGRVQFLAGGSGFLSQHSKTLHFGLGGEAKAKVRVVWPSGLKSEFPDLEPGFTYSLVEGASAPSAQRAFLPRKAWPHRPVSPSNHPEPAQTWLREPVPLPKATRGPGFLLLVGDDATPPLPKPLPKNVPLEVIDLRREKDEVAASFALFRRYLLEYRTGLTLPLLLLVDERSCARKIYTGVPPDAELSGDLRRINDSHDLALPFTGTYFSPPRRNYFKLGAAFYWAGYPHLALPYLQETLRREPSNWRTLLAIARLHAELGHDQEALRAYEGVLAIHPEYVPALIESGETQSRMGNRNEALEAMERALALDPGSADAMNQMGVLAGSEDRFAEAKQWFQQAIAAQRNHAGAINNLGVLYAKTGQKNDAIAAFRYGIEVAPDDETLYLNLGRIYVTMDERERARAVLRKLLERQPGNAVATRALGELDRR